MPLLSRAVHAALAAGNGNRRVANHQQWEDDDATGAIKAKVGAARRSAASQRGSRRASPRTQRNNRREY
jgi:hypothetical protein